MRLTRACCLYRLLPSLVHLAGPLTRLWLVQVFFGSADADMVHHFSFVRSSQEYMRKSQGSTEAAVTCLFRQVLQPQQAL